ncbi:hypothetical protein [Geobacillus zalihae]|uniref:hypothetical protein n=1 Tax=Geobacillus zalihae TaxID=213419 RepID=UPI0016817084|nr:hypothetical protein [Geobacillus zalihae]QNU24369.1 hypothetical protein IC806_15360 [Geobacillus zalihae]
MIKIAIAVISSFIIAAGGYIGYKEFIKAKPKKQVSVPKEPENQVQQEEKNSFVKLNEREVKKILQHHIDGIFDVFQRAGKTYGWNNANPADFSKIRPELLKYATESFADTTLKKLAANYYCECDVSFKPDIEYDVRFSFEQNKSDELKTPHYNPLQK